MDVLSIMSMINIFGFIFIMDYCVRKQIKITITLIFLWVIFIAIITIPISIATVALYGQTLTTDEFGALITNLVGLVMAFLIVDIVMFFIARFIYRKVPSIKSFLGHDKISAEKEELKHMSKITIYTHEKPGSKEFEAIKGDAEKLIKDHASVDQMQVEKGKEELIGRRRHKK